MESIEYKIDFVDTSIKMLSTWLQNKWNTEFQEDNDALPEIKLVRSTDDLRTYKEESADNKLQYPLIMLILTSIGPDTDKGGFGKRFLSRQTGRTENNEQVEISNLLPVKLGLGLTLRTDDLDDLIKIAHILMFSAPKIVLRLRNDLGFTFEISVNIDGELTIPGADMGFPSKEFRFETSLFIQGYLIRSRMQGVIRKVVMDVVDSGGISTLGEFPDIGTLATHSIKHTDILNKNSPYYVRPQ